MTVIRRDQFVETHRARWDRLADLSRRAQRNLHALTGAEILELGALYRSTTRDLAIARRDFPDDSITAYLNHLVANAHGVIYQGQPSSPQKVWDFVRFGFPAAVRGAAPYILVAFAVSASAALISALLVTVEPRLADLLLPGEAVALRSVLAHHHLWVKSATSNHSVAANFIMLNNIKVAFFAFAGGVLLGLGSLFVMVVNGINLGAVSALTAQYGLGLDLLAFVVPHGVIELSVIFFAGGAGLMIGDSVLRPGLLPRTDALARAAARAAIIVMGCAPLLVIAGTIEAFFSPSDAPMPLKFLFAAVVGTALYTYVLFSRRPDEQRPDYMFQDII